MMLISYDSFHSALIAPSFRIRLCKKVQWKRSIKQSRTLSPQLTQDVFAHEMELYWLRLRASLTCRIVAGEKEWTSSLIFYAQSAPDMLLRSNKGRSISVLNMGEDNGIAFMTNN